MCKTLILHIQLSFSCEFMHALFVTAIYRLESVFLLLTLRSIFITFKHLNVV